MKKILWVIIAIVIVVGVTFIVQQPGQKSDNGLLQDSSVLDTSGETVIQDDYIRYFGQQDQTAFDLLQQISKVEYDSYDFGIFVKSINNIQPQEGYFWKLYLNGQESQVGADQLKTQDGDLIEWRMEEVQ